MKIIRLITLLAVIVITTTANAQTKYKTVKHAPEYFPDKQMGETKANFIEIIQKETKISDTKSGIWGNPKNVMVLDDRIEFTIKNQKMIINFSDLIDHNIEIHELSMSENDGPYFLMYYELTLGNFVLYFRKNYEAASQIASDLFFIQHQLRKNYFSTQLALFKPMAELYRDLKVKPPISEEQRKYIVQANASNQQHVYLNAIELYNKANEIDPTSYPAAYSNLALLSAQVSKYDAAVYYMKKYLLLEPEASDARGAQDKIYEWEARIPK